MVTNAAAEPSVQAPDPEQDEEMGFTAQQLRFLRQLVQGQPWEERPRTLDPTPGETHRVHVLSPMGWPGWEATTAVKVTLLFVACHLRSQKQF